jgi:CRISPR-associated endonuclease/helicase Cas3
MADEFFAHIRSGFLSTDRQFLEDHLKNVAEMARKFASEFGAEDWGYFAGLWHDIGKYSREFQEYLCEKADPDACNETRPGRVDHSSAGAQYAVRIFPILGHLLAYAIAGHHSGLLNGRDVGSCQEARLKKKVHEWEHGLQFLIEFSPIDLPKFLKNALAIKDPFTTAFFTRMLFSCLVDADFLDTEAFMNPQQSILRGNWPDSILQQMDEALTEYIQILGRKETQVDRQRALVREACLKAAEQEPGLFSLSVPTGGGKTLSSLAFALRHAVRHGLHRVIYVVPLTSIIEQNADVFREVLKPVTENLGRDVVLEHHSNLDPEEETTLNRLAAENWDAPLIVTTSVQFYESLFANKTSSCRKLHRLARSVIILDEAQTLPVEYLGPCLRALNELTTNYMSSIVICTATQPAFEKREQFEIGLSKPFEIIPDPVTLYAQLKRVRVADIGSQTDHELCKRIMAHPQVLIIVNTKRHARRLFEAIGASNGHFHLSGNMCPAHRSDKLKMIKEYLAEGRVCRVVSTQVIEAGVDIDFPVVFRSLAGLDSIAQAAGRCNRNGRLSEGEIYIFRSEDNLSERFFYDTAQCAGQVLKLYRDPLDLQAIHHYFRLYYWDQSARWDQKRVLDHFFLNNDRAFPFNFRFAKAGEVFQLIDDSKDCPIIVPWRDEGRRLCEHLRAMPIPTLEIRRQLQRYVVSIPRKLLAKHIGIDIQLIHDGIPILISPDIHYSEETGLNLDGTDQRAIFG